MGNFLTIEFQGLEQLKKYAGKLNGKMKSAVNDELNATALAIETKAKQLAPKNYGQLAQSIEVTKRYLDKDVNVIAGYAAYVEFGTGTQVRVPAEWRDYAAQFKGKTGETWREFLKALVDWVRKKGLAGTYSVKTQKRTGKKNLRDLEDIEVAYAIMRSILAKGIKPHPFLFPAFKEATNGIEERIVKALEDEGNEL